MDKKHVEKYVFRIVGLNIARLREDKKVSQSALARMVELNRSNINQIENGKQNVSIAYLVKIADGLDVAITDFFRDLDGEAPSRLYESSEQQDVQDSLGE